MHKEGRVSHSEGFPLNIIKLNYWLTPPPGRSRRLPSSSFTSLKGFRRIFTSFRSSLGRRVYLFLAFMVIAMLASLLPLTRGSYQAAYRALQSNTFSAFVGPRVGQLGSVCSRLFSSGEASSDTMNSSISSSQGTCSSAEQGNCSEKQAAFTPTEHPAFDLVKTQYVAEYDLHVVDYKHKKSGANIVSLTCPKTETEKAFMVAIRTPVTSCNGAPHILEHSVLMGSAKYPLKEPFVALMKSSLYTYMNALTYPDRTCYPVASVNDKDFYNLASVYMDAVFQPKALEDHLTLRQEGWRYELTPKDMPAVSTAGSDPEEAEAQIEEYAKQTARCLENPFDCDFKIQGVVLNEMKGVYSSPDSLHSRLKQRSLFPNLPHYNLDSGGDPKMIPSLSYEQFKQFYNERYYPANARIYFWGADNVQKRLNFVDEYLKELPDRQGIDTTIGTQKQLTEPRYVEEPYPASPEKLEDFISVNWVLDAVPEGAAAPPELSAADRMALQLLSYLLLGTSSSPLYKALSESGLGKSVIGGGLGLDLRHATFSVGLKGVAQEEDMVEKVEKVIFRCLSSLSEEGFSKDAIEAALNTMQFTLRELNTGTFPKGLSIILDMATESNYDRDPVACLSFDASLKAVREKLKKEDEEGGYSLFQSLIRRFLLNNTHRVTVRLRADPEMTAREAKQEKDNLSQIQKQLTPEVVESVLADQIALKQRQLTEDSEEALKTLPVLKLEDVADANNEVPYEVSALNDVPLISHELPTSNILYAEIYLSLADLELEDLPLLRLFSRLILETGTHTLTPEQLQHHIGKATGGITAATDIRSISAEPGTAPDPLSSLGFLVLSGKAMKDRVADLFCLFSTVLQDSRLSVSSRAKEILREAVAAAEAAVMSSGHRAAARRILASLTATGLANELRMGVAFRDAAKQLLQQAETNWEAVEDRLYKLKDKLLRRENLLINLTGDAETLAAATAAADGKDALSSFIEGFPVKQQAAAAAAAAASSNERFFSTPFRQRGIDREPLWVQQIKQNNLLHRPVREALLIPTKVNYVSRGGRACGVGSVISGCEFVAARSVSVHYLWRSIREVGGAYGASFMFDFSGLFVFTSYRDPQLLQTLKAFNNTPQFLNNFSKHLTQQDINKAILTVLRDIDAPLPPDQLGSKSLWQLLARQTQQHRQLFRQQVLQTTKEDFAAFAEKLQAALDKETNVAVVSSEEACEEANSRDSTLLLKPLHVFSDSSTNTNSSSSSSSSTTSSSSTSSSSSSSSSNGPTIAVA